MGRQARIGFGLAAALALVLVAAPAALATQFASTSSPVKLLGASTAKHAFVVDGVSFECNVSLEKASQTTPTNTVSGLAATYSGCVMAGTEVGTTTISMESCSYELLQPNLSLVGNLAIRCGASPIKIKYSHMFGACEVNIGETSNTNLAKLEYANVAGSPTTVKMTADVSAISVTKVQDTGVCPLAGTGAGTATYKGATTLSGASGVGVSIRTAAEFKSTSSPVKLLGESTAKHVFTIDGQKFECNVSFEKASQATPTATVTGLAAAYSGCVLAGAESGTTTIAMEGCSYDLLQPNTSLVGNLAIRCGANPVKLKFTFGAFGTCEVKIGETSNTNLAKLEYANVAGSPTTVKMTANVSGITVSKTVDSGVCPLAGTGAGTATYDGPTTLSGASGVGVSVS